jgi:hypothetical protein
MLQKYILAIITIFSACTLTSQNNSLVIFSSSGDPFLLVVDGTGINTVPQSNIKAFDLTVGRHTIEITVPSTTLSLQLKDSVLFVNEPKYSNKEFTYALVHNGKKLSLEFKSVSELSGPVVPPVPEAPKETAPVVDNSVYGNLYQAKNNKPVFFTNYNSETSSCQTVLNDKDMTYAVKLLKSINDEERQLSYVKSIVQNNCYTTAQLQQMLLTFPSEMDRLEIAKPAYWHISDKKNIPQMYAVFKYQTIKDNYSAYIQDQENTAMRKKLNCTEPLDVTRFEQLYTKVKNSGYENEKLAAVKRSLVNVCLSTEQAQKLASLFTHDREKLDCLKCAYLVIVDKDKASVLAEQFQFSETKAEFLKFISK